MTSLREYPHATLIVVCVLKHHLRAYRTEPEPDVPGASALYPRHPEEEVQPEAPADQLAPDRT